MAEGGSNSCLYIILCLCCVLCGAGIGAAGFVAYTVYNTRTVCSAEKFHGPCYWYVQVTGKQSHEQFGMEANRNYYCENNIYVKADRTRIGTSMPVKVMNEKINAALVKYKFLGYKSGNTFRNDPDPAWDTRVGASGGQEGYITYIGLKGTKSDQDFKWFDGELLGDWHNFDMGDEKDYKEWKKNLNWDEDWCVGIEPYCLDAMDNAECMGSWRLVKCSCDETAEMNSENPITGSREIDVCLPNYYTEAGNTNPVADGFWCMIAPGEYDPFV